MNRWIRGILMGAFTFTLFYLAGAFIGWSFNPGEWEPMGRALLGAVGAISSAVMGMAVLSVFDEPTR